MIWFARVRVIAMIVAAAGCGGGAASSPTVAKAAGPAKAAPPAVRGDQDRSPDAEAAQVGLGMVLLAEHRLPAPADVISALASLAPDEPPLLAGGHQNDSLFFQLDGAMATISLMPPVPGGEADYHATFGFKGLLDGWKPPAHAAHLMVVYLGDPGTPIARVRRTHRLIAAVTEAAGDNAVGVYIGNGGVTQEPEFYVGAIRAEADAMFAWSGISAAQENGRISLLSTGMGQFGLPEIHITTSQMKPGEAIATIYDVMLYVARRGTPLPDGDTVGRDATERLTVRYAKSPVPDSDAQVMRIDYP